VLADKKGKVINTRYQTRPDNIVGKMDHRHLGKEMAQQEQAPRLVTTIA